MPEMSGFNLYDIGALLLFSDVHSFAFIRVKSVYLTVQVSVGLSEEKKIKCSELISPEEVDG